MDLYYSTGKTKKAFVHFVTGRTLSAAISFVVTILIIRKMPVDGYAQYTVLLGLTAIIGAASSFALEHVGQRYIPELISQKQVHIAYRLFWILFLLRILFLVFALFLLVSFSQSLQPVYPAFSELSDILVLWGAAALFVTALRSAVFFLEILLHQKTVKWLSVLLAALRLVFIVLVILYWTDISIEAALCVDGAAHLVILVPAIIHFIRNTIRTKKEASAREGILDNSFILRLWKYAKYSSIRELVFLFSAPAANRLVVGRTQYGSDMAAYGVAQSLYDIIERYTPSIFLNNLIKPVLVARYSKNRSHEQISQFGNLILKINLLFIFPMIFMFIVYGEDLSILITDNKYTSSGIILAALLVILALRGHYYVIELHAVMSENMRSLFVASIVMSIWIIPALIVTPIWGVWGLVSSRIVFMLLRDIYLIGQLNRNGIKAGVDYGAIARMLTAFAVVTGAALLIKENVAGLVPGLVVNVTLMFLWIGGLVFLSSFFNNEEQRVINDTSGRRIFRPRVE